jgi:type IV pilus assembly protein PilM
MPFRIFPKSFLGIDIGTSAIKGIELTNLGRKTTLTNYFLLPTFIFYQKEVEESKKSIIFLPSEELAEAIKVAIQIAKIKTKNCVFSLPDFLTFFTIINLPPMNREEIDSAVKIEARRYIPVPIKEVTLDWQIIESNSPEKGWNILLVAIPNELIYKYQKIALLANLKIVGLEAEVFSLIRSLIKGEDKEKIILILDIGTKSTSCSIVEKGVLKTYHSLNISSLSLSEKLSFELEIDLNLAEKLKKTWGIDPENIPFEGKEKEIYLSIFSLALNPLLNEVDEILKNFYLKEGKEVDKIILAGGSGKIPGVVNFLEKHFKKKVELGEPFSEISFPPQLEGILQKIGPELSIAIGAALRNLI